MFKKLSFALLVVFTASVVLWGCKSPYEKLRRSTDSAKKFEKAKEYYEKKDYFRALPLFEELVNVYRGTGDAEQIYFYYAYCHYGMNDLISARYHFKVFAETYPKSKYAEEALYMSAYCYYKDSPTYSLAQENTYKAIEALQLFINIYPKSGRVAAANDLIDQLRTKLETKSFNAAKLYYNIRDYKAAIISFNNSADDFPDSKYREEMAFLIIKSHYLYAKNSVEAKKEERYKAAIAAYQNFVDTYTTSKYLDDAQNIYDATLKQLDELKKSPITKLN